MESAFYCLVRNETATASSLVEFYISEARPLSDDDMNAELRSVFNAFEYAAEPVTFQRVDAFTAQVGWNVEFDHSPVHELIVSLQTAGCVVKSPVLWLESGELLRIVQIDAEHWHLSPVLEDGEEQMFDDEELLHYMLKHGD